MGSGPSGCGSAGGQFWRNFSGRNAMRPRKKCALKWIKYFLEGKSIFAAGCLCVCSRNGYYPGIRRQDPAKHTFAKEIGQNVVPNIFEIMFEDFLKNSLAFRNNQDPEASARFLFVEWAVRIGLELNKGSRFPVSDVFYLTYRGGTNLVNPRTPYF